MAFMQKDLLDMKPKETLNINFLLGILKSVTLLRGRADLESEDVLLGELVLEAFTAI